MDLLFNFEKDFFNSIVQLSILGINRANYENEKNIEAYTTNNRSSKSTVATF